ncbi:hypothetical protein [Vibrio sp. CUB2]|uniref:hypothetical protein n=1 Tax=Vibrio sp. CUB2 TaxID=2315233 RepID=UPI000769F80F|nr:hypothetical protein [Vibrio sp. CUB2]
MIETQEYKASFSVFDNTPTATTNTAPVVPVAPVAPVAPIEVMDTSLPEDFFKNIPDLPLQVVEVPPLSAYADEPNVQGDTQVTAPVTPEINAPVNTDNNVVDTSESIGSSGSVTPVALAVVQAYEASKDELGKVDRPYNYYIRKRYNQTKATSLNPDDPNYTGHPFYVPWIRDYELFEDHYIKQADGLGVDYTQEHSHIVINCTKYSIDGYFMHHPVTTHLMPRGEQAQASARGECLDVVDALKDMSMVQLWQFKEDFRQAQAFQLKYQAKLKEKTSLADEPNNFGSALAS